MITPLNLVIPTEKKRFSIANICIVFLFCYIISVSPYTKIGLNYWRAHAKYIITMNNYFSHYALSAFGIRFQSSGFATAGKFSL